MLCIYRVLNAQLVPYAHCLGYIALLLPRASNSAYSVKCSAYGYIMILCYALLSDTCAEHGACLMKCSALKCMLCFTQQAEGWSALKSILLCEQLFSVRNGMLFELYSTSNSGMAAEDWSA